MEKHHVPRGPIVVDVRETDSDVESSEVKEKRKLWGSCCWKIGCKVWCKKYFWEGQALNEAQQEAIDNLPADAPLMTRILVKHRRIVGILIPMTIYHFWWWSIMIRYNLFYNFSDKYFMSLVMIVGGFVAGGTTEGGGAVAFPTMTLAFGIAAKTARDFSLLIQASGMSGASFVILFMGIKVEWYAIVFCSLGGLAGSIPGLYWLDPLISAAWKKMFFSSVWFSFACALLALNWISKRITYTAIPKMNNWKILGLLIAGWIGGTFTAIVGTGLDICVFSVLTLVFRISEKVATPTAVCIMAWNSIFTALWRHVMMEGIARETWEFLSVTFEVVTIMAPFGAVISSHMHRQVLAAFVYILDFSALIGAFVIIPMTIPLAAGSCGIIVGCFFIFWALIKIGGRIMDNYEEEKRVTRNKSQAALKKSNDKPGLSIANGVGNSVAEENADGGIRNVGFSMTSDDACDRQNPVIVCSSKM